MYINKNLNSYSLASSRRTSLGMGIGFSNLLSKSKPQMSDKDFKAAMVEQAKKDAANGIFQGKECRAIDNAYTSVVSPDRKGIVRNLGNTTFGNGIPSYVDVKQAGSSIASFSSARGWETIITKAEADRGAEIRGIYNKVWDEIFKSMGGDISKVNDPRYTYSDRIFSKSI